ncbi:MAG: protein kinase [Herpetosiphonaceae bacterium]|nr:protein kinase [Herpetosiphonaceae bacterium]
MLQPETLLAGRYRIQDMVGTGGMGTVYAARDERLGRDVAIKLLRPDLAAQPQEHQRFLNEGQIAAQVVHPHIVRTYDAGDAPEGPFLVQELLQGRSLDQALPLPVDQSIDVVANIADALGALHEHGYIHCDVKPQNIWLRPNGEAVLLDFGIARVEGTHTTTLIATPQYLAPERLDGGPPTAASDLYALGAVLYQLLTGRLPFDGPELQAILAAQRSTPVPPLGIAEPKAPPLDRIIARLMAKVPAERYPSAAALQHDLQVVRAANGRMLEQQGQPTLVVAPPRQPAPSGEPAVPSAALPAAFPLPTAATGGSPALPRRRSCWLPLLLLLLLLCLVVLTLGRRARALQRITPSPQSQIMPVASPVATANFVVVPDLTNQTATAIATPPQMLGLQVPVAPSPPPQQDAPPVAQPPVAPQAGGPVAQPPLPPARRLPFLRPGRGKGKK